MMPEKYSVEWFAACAELLAEDPKELAEWLRLLKTEAIEIGMRISAKMGDDHPLAMILFRLDCLARDAIQDLEEGNA